VSAKRPSRRNRQNRSATPATDEPTHTQSPKTLGMVGGRYNPLSETDLQQIDEAVRYIVSTVGFSEVPDIVSTTALNRGATLSDDRRLLFPQALFDEALKNVQRNFSLYGQTDEAPKLTLSGKRVHVGSGGAAPQVVDIDSGHYRDATLNDLYDAARLVESQANIHFFSRSLVARDMPDLLSLDINTAYACLAGTAKHICTSVSKAEHVEKIAEMCFMIAGSKEAFLARPFLSLNINHVVSPLRLDKESCEVMAEAARIGINACWNYCTKYCRGFCGYDVCLAH